MNNCEKNIGYDLCPDCKGGEAIAFKPARGFYRHIKFLNDDRAQEPFVPEAQPNKTTIKIPKKIFEENFNEPFSSVAH